LQLTAPDTADRRGVTRRENGARWANGTLEVVLERWTRAVVRWRAVVVAGWVAIIVLGIFSAVRLPALLTTSLTVPGTSSAQANQILEKHFAENIEGSFTVIVRPSKPTSSRLATMNREFAAASTALPHARASRLTSTAGVLYGTVTTPLDLGQAAPSTTTLRHALARAGLGDSQVTGAPALQHDITPVLTSDLRHGELLAVLVALLVLVLVLGLSWAVLVPLVVAGATMAGALSIIFLLAHHFLMVLYIPNLVELIGLGLAVDYSLLIVHRYREELTRSPASPVEAVVATMDSAGRTVLVSGLAVTLGLAVLFLIPVPFVRSLGFAGLAVPIVSVASALTLQPVLLSLLARRGVKIARPFRAGLRQRPGPRPGAWARLATFVTGRPVAVALAATVILLLAATSVLWLQLTPGSLSAIPQNSQAARGLATLQSRGGPGIVTPTQIVIDAGGPGRALDPSVSAATLRLAVTLTKDPEVFFVSIGSTAPYVDPSHRYRQIEVIGRHEFGAESSQALVKRIRDVDVPAADFPAGVRVSVGGAPAQGVDFLNRVYGNVAWIMLLVLALAYLVLVRAFRSLVLALMAVVLNLLSIAATYGLVVVVFRFGLGADTVGLYRVSQIEGWVPVFLFAMLFGLSMDYEVFFVTRMREAWDHGATTRGAIVDGMSHTGRVVSAAALIMVGALLGLILGRVAGLQELGVGLALGVLVDATVVRGLLMPSLMSLAGRWNWWLPTWTAQLLRVRASPLAAAEGRGARGEGLRRGVEGVPYGAATTVMAKRMAGSW
jgi:RND superfamily putative drug exporter